MKGEGNELDSSLWKASIAPGNDRIRGKRQGQEARAISLVLVLSLGAYLPAAQFQKSKQPNQKMGQRTK